MSMEVQQFLNDTGGNFTEMAPRPPVPGEENELQSNGGMSTRSSGSYKSHLSGKSHSSGKSGASRSDISHSPAATPRRSNLDKTGESLSNSQTKLNDDEAPLGFEPEGSAASSPPFNENSTPSYQKWAEELKHLLDDSDGVKLFKQFLDQEHCSNTLDFWFACSGLKLVPPNDNKRIFSLSKLIYKKYIKGDQLNLKADVKKNIIDRLKREQVDQTLFNEAQTEVESMMRRDTYPLFLKSDIYVQYVQNGGESPKTASNNSSGSNSARPLSGPLPTLHEGEELKQEDIQRTPVPTLPLTPSSLIATSRIRRHHEPWNISRNEGVYSGGSHGRVPANPYHYSYAPVSTQDSELQSLSSDALTDDTMSLTDSSVDGRDIPPYGSKAWKKHQKAIRRYADSNKHTNLNQNFIPRTERAPKDRNLAEKDPGKFAEMLTEKLKKVVEERETLEHIRQSFQTIDVQLTDDEVDHTIGSMGPPPPKTNVSMNTSMASSLPLNVLLTSAMAQKENEDNAQSILEEHVSRIWDSSNGQTPSRSPGRHSPPKSWSPDRSLQRRGGGSGSGGGTAYPHAPGPSPNVSGTMLFPTVPKTPGHHRRREGKEKDNTNNNVLLSHTSFDSGMGGEDRLADKSAQYYSSSESSEVRYKHVHHHHHHHHHLGGKDAKARHPAETPETNNHHPMNYYISAPALRGTPAAHAGQSNDDPAGRGRSRDAKRPSGKKTLDSSSNLDSGVSLKCDALHVPNLHDPNNEKVLSWMLENEKISTGNTQYSTDGSDKGSSHKRSSHKSSSPSQHKSTSSSTSKKPVQYNVSRSGSLDRSGVHAFMQAPPGGDFSFNSSSVSGGGVVMPAQPIVQDPSMPLLNPPNPTTQLEEAKRRLEDESKMRMLKSKSFTSSSSRDRRQMPPPGHPITQRSYKNIPQVAPLDLSSSEEQSSGSHKSDSKRSSSKRPSSSAPTTPAGQPAVTTQQASHNPSEQTVVGYYFCGEPIPYRTTVYAKNITLAQFKQLISKKGNYRYYFKKACDEFDSGVVHEEYIDDSALLPLWEGKIVGKVEKVE